MASRRHDPDWTALRVGVAVVGWALVALLPLQGGTAGSASLWGANADARGYLLPLGVLLLLLAAAASSSAKGARLALWITFGLLVASGLVVSVAALLALPFAIAVVVLRTRRHLSASSSPRAAREFRADLGG